MDSLVHVLSFHRRVPFTPVVFCTDRRSRLRLEARLPRKRLVWGDSYESRRNKSSRKPRASLLFQMCPSLKTLDESLSPSVLSFLVGYVSNPKGFKCEEHVPTKDTVTPCDRSTSACGDVDVKRPSLLIPRCTVYAHEKGAGHDETIQERGPGRT